MSNVIQGNFRKPAIDDLYSLPVTYTNNVILVDFNGNSDKTVWDNIVDSALMDMNYFEYEVPLYQYANYLGESGLDEQDVYEVIEAIVNPHFLQYADDVVKDIAYEFNNFLEIC